MTNSKLESSVDVVVVENMNFFQVCKEIEATQKKIYRLRQISENASFYKLSKAAKLEAAEEYLQRLEDRKTEIEINLGKGLSWDGKEVDALPVFKK